MADISVDSVNYDIVVTGGDLVFTSDTDYTETMRQKIKAYLLTFLGEWFLDDPDNLVWGIPYFQSLFADKIPTIELADAIFRKALLSIDGVTGVRQLTFDYDNSTRILNVTFRVTIEENGAVVEDIIVFPI